jgi:hypothetical protein
MTAGLLVARRKKPCRTLSHPRIAKMENVIGDASSPAVLIAEKMKKTSSGLSKTRGGSHGRIESDGISSR